MYFFKLTTKTNYKEKFYVFVYINIKGFLHIKTHIK